MRTQAAITGVIALLLCLVAPACRRTHDAGHLARVDSLLRTTDSLIALMGAVDTTDIAAWNALYGGRRGQLIARLGDTLAKAEALTLGNYHRLMDKTLGRARAEHGPALDGLQRARAQLLDLRNDVEKGLLEPADEELYIEQERLALRAVAHNASVVMSTYANARSTLQELDPLVDSLLRMASPAAP